MLSAKVEGIGYREVARHVGKSLGAVKKIASRAIGRVRPPGGDRPVKAAAE